MSDNNQPDSDRFPVNRRALLKGTGAGLVGISGITEVAATTNTSGGGEIWTFTAGDGVESPLYDQVNSSPTVVDGSVFVARSDADEGGSVYALNATDGTEQWQFKNNIGIDSSPTVVGGTVYVGGYRMFALSASDGTEQWRNDNIGITRSSPTVADGTVFVGGGEGNVYALNAINGTEQWHFATGERVESSPTVVDDTVFVGSNDGTVYALNAGDGTQKWNFATGGAVQSSPTVVNDTVFVGSNDNNVYALNVSNGVEQWRFTTGNQVKSSPTVVDETVFIGSRDRNVYALGASDGTEQWRFTTGAPVFSSPTVADGTVFVGSWDGKVYALNASDGAKQWQFETGGGVGEIKSSPTVVNGTVFVGNGMRAGNVYAIDAGVSGSSEGSRVDLGTLGHHFAWADEDPPGSGSNEPPIAQFTYDSESGQNGVEIHKPVTFDATGSSDPDGTITSYEWAFSNDGEYEKFGQKVTHTFATSGDKTVTLRVTNDSGETASSSQTISANVPQSFTPAVHGFGFDNWQIGEAPEFEEVYQIVSTTFKSELQDRGIDTSVPGFVPAIAGIAYTAMDGGFMNGHCLGMTNVARRYYNEGVPELPEYDQPVETAAGITTEIKDGGSGYKSPEPVPALEPVERDIDEVQTAQAMDLQVLRYVAEVFAPQSGPGSINHAAVIDAVEQKLENGELVSISLVDSSGGVIESFMNGHQVLAYGSIERTTQGGLEIVNIPIYNPNFAAEYYESDTETLSFKRSGPDDEFSLSYDGANYEDGAYDRAIVLYENDPEYDLEFFDDGNDVDGYQTALSQGLSDFISVGVKSPVTLNVTAPDGTPVPKVDIPTEQLQTATEYEELHILPEAPSGDYNIEATATGSGEYTVEVKGTQAEGGTVNASHTDTVSEGDTETLSATVPDTTGESGSVKPTDGDATIVNQYDDNDDGDISLTELQDAAVDYGQGDLSFQELKEVVIAFAESGS